MAKKNRKQIFGPAVRCIPNPGSRTVLICFGGVAGELGIDAFEFERITGDLPVSRIMLKDPNRKFYLAGVPGLGTTVRKTVSGLETLIGRMQATHVVCLGNSMGGFGALLYGALLDAALTQAFKTRTTVHWNQLRRMGDYRRYRSLLRLNLTAPLCWPYRDLRSVLSRRGDRNGRVDIFYPSGDRLYATYARHLEGLPGVTLHEEEHPPCGRNLVRFLRDSGRLRLLLEKAVHEVGGISAHPTPIGSTEDQKANR